MLQMQYLLGGNSLIDRFQDKLIADVDVLTLQRAGGIAELFGAGPGMTGLTPTSISRLCLRPFFRAGNFCTNLANPSTIYIKRLLQKTNMAVLEKKWLF